MHCQTLRFHDLRHTAATLLLGRGVHPKIVSEMLGHSTIAITLDLYSHVTPSAVDRASPHSPIASSPSRSHNAYHDQRRMGGAIGYGPTGARTRASPRGGGPGERGHFFAGWW